MYQLNEWCKSFYFHCFSLQILNNIEYVNENDLMFFKCVLKKMNTYIVFIETLSIFLSDLYKR